MASPTDLRLRVAVVGAGIAGLTAARSLSEDGHDVVVFDKGRGVGGRTCIRRHDGYEFDHGAQYFTARDPRFAACVERWRQVGVVARWDARLVAIDRERTVPKDAHTRRFVAVPGMNALAAHLARGLDVSRGTGVSSVAWDDGWRLGHDRPGDLGGYDTLLLALPPAQAEALLGDPGPLSAPLQTLGLLPCWATLLGFDTAADTGFDGAFVNTGPLSWVCRNSAKPGRGDRGAWVLHASPAWSVEHLEDPRDSVAAALHRAFAALPGVDLPAPVVVVTQRWRYASQASPGAASPRLALWDPARRLACAGDWCAGGKIQGAWLSGRAAARLIAPSPGNASHQPIA